MSMSSRILPLAGAALAFAVNAAAAAPQYHLVDLGPGTGTKLNWYGEVSGRTQGRPALWHDGAWHFLHGSHKTVVDDLGNNRVAVGTRGLGRGDHDTPIAVMWKPDGRQLDLVPDAARSYGRFIRSDGTAYGMAEPKHGHAYPFSFQAGRLTALPYVEDWAWTKPNAVNDVRQIAATGQSVPQDGQCPSEPLLYTNGAWVHLGSLGGDCGSAIGINDDGVVVGFSTVAGSDAAHAFRWFDGVMTDLGSLGGGYAWANDINEEGTTVGYSADAKLNPHAVVWRDGPITALDTVVDAQPDGEMIEALSINENGQILVRGVGNDLKDHTYRLDPM